MKVVTFIRVEHDMTRRTLFAVLLLLVVITGFAYYMFFSNNTLSHHKKTWLCFLEPSTDSGVEQVFIEAVNGSRVCPVLYSVSIRLRPGYRLKSARVGSSTFGKPSFKVLVDENATLRIETERIRVHVEILSNTTGSYAIINGVNVTLPYSLEVFYGDRISVTPLNTTNRIALNQTVTLIAQRDIALRLYFVNASSKTKRIDWRYTGRLPECDGVLVYSNARNATALVNGRNVTLPFCAKPPVLVRGVYKQQLNATHSLWLAWYWVDYGSERVWWSYGINGSTLKIRKPARVEIHYLLGLKDLPYVLRIDPVVFEDWFKEAPWNVSQDGGEIRIIGLNKTWWGEYIFFVIVVVPKEVGWLRVRVSGLPSLSTIYISPVLLLGQEYNGPAFAKYSTSGTVVVDINMTAFRLYWLAKSKGEKAVLKNWGNFKLDHEGIKTVEAAKNLKLKPAERLPNTGEQALLIVFYGRYSRAVSVSILGVAP